MAKEIEWADDPGLTEYVNLTNAVGQWYNTVGAAFEAFNAANWTDYDLAGTEFGSSGVYTADMPAVAAGVYNLVARRRAGVNPAQSDLKIGTGSIEWTGSLVGSFAVLIGAPVDISGNGATLAGMVLDTNIHVESVINTLGTPVVGSFGTNIDQLVDVTNSIQAQTDLMGFTGNFIQCDVRDWKGATAPANTGDAFARLGAPAGASVSADIAGIPAAVWAFVIETGKTAIQCLRLIAAALAGKRSNAGTLTEQYDAVGAPGTPRIVANLDSSGNGTPTLTP